MAGKRAGKERKAFQFTPLREGRLLTDGNRGNPNVFQFTPLREGRRQARLHRRAVSISIHAPPRGATGVTGFLLAKETHFNSRPSARGDTSRPTARANSTYFNSRPSARGDTRRAHGTARSLYFNSRPSARGDWREWRDSNAAGISIHAPPRGATRLTRKPRHLKNISIHAPPRGATLF